MKISCLLTIALSAFSFHFFAAIHHVTPSGAGLMDGTSWSNAFPGEQLQTVIDNAIPGDQLWVACGVYYTTATIDREIAFHMKNNVEIIGSFQGTETLLSERVFTCGACSILSGSIGDVNIDDNSYHVISNGTGIDNSAVLDGFVIEDANDNRSAGMDEGLGGGVFNNGGYPGNSCNPSFRNCVIRNNFAQFGAGMFNSGHTQGIASPDLLNCIIIDNHAYIGGGGMDNFGLNGNASPSLTNTIVYGNVAEGRAGGMYNWAGNEGTTTPKITNCVFAHNSATDGGGLVSDQLNSGTGSSGTSNPMLLNTIFWGNTASGEGPQFFLLGDASFTASVSDIDLTGQDFPHVITTGLNNLEADPLFININNPIGDDNCWLTEDDGLRLQHLSTLINMGSADDAPSTDITGTEHILNPEIGAYEYIDNTGFKAVSNHAELSVSPNPARDLILVKGFTGQNIESRVFNSLGQEIAKINLKDNQLNVSELPSGVYFLEIQASVLRFVKD
ncbi:MAG: hypothetical protein K0R65_543 [Crocinitomicaceae bacterium]|jgi:hypothetical protein|nr:hypothetical protein [Crocinitomicaceae bacterium]